MKTADRRHRRAHEHVRRQPARIVQPDDYAAGSARGGAARVRGRRRVPAARARGGRRGGCSRRRATRSAQLVGHGRARPRHRAACRSSRSAAAPAGSAATSPRCSGSPCVVPPDAEVISSIGDALSLVRAARERTDRRPDRGGRGRAGRRRREGGRRRRGRARDARGAHRVRRRPQGAARGGHGVDRARSRRGARSARRSPSREIRTRATEHGFDAVARVGGVLGRDAATDRVAGARPLRRRRRRHRGRRRARRPGSGVTRDEIAGAIEQRTRATSVR